MPYGRPDYNRPDAQSSRPRQAAPRRTPYRDRSPVQQPKFDPNDILGGKNSESILAALMAWIIANCDSTHWFKISLSRSGEHVVMALGEQGCPMEYVEFRNIGDVDWFLSPLSETADQN